MLDCGSRHKYYLPLVLVDFFKKLLNLIKVVSVVYVWVLQWSVTPVDGQVWLNASTVDRQIFNYIYSTHAFAMVT